MNAAPFIAEAELARRLNNYRTAAILYRVAAEFAKDDEERGELIHNAEELEDVDEETAELERLYAR